MKGPLDSAQELLSLAAEDLVAGEATASTGTALFAACFHAQQAAEKSLKALLALDDVVYPWTHDLRELLELLGPSQPKLVEMRQAITALTPFAVAGRYTTKGRPDQDTARSALETAKQMYALADQVLAERKREGQGLDSADPAH